LQLGDHAVQVEHRGLSGLTPAEGQQLVGEGGRPGGGDLDLPYLLFEAGGQVATHQGNICIAEDGGQYVVEIMGYTARKSAHRLDFLCPSKLFFPFLKPLFGFYPVGDIP
jgi:hypothetical protein